MVDRACSAVCISALANRFPSSIAARRDATLAGPSPGRAGSLAEIEASEAGKTSAVGEEAVGIDDRAAAAAPGPDQHRQKLGIGKRACTIVEQTLARPLRRLHIADTLCSCDSPWGVAQAWTGLARRVART